MDFLKNLNPKQIEAVKTTDGPVLILAGAGSGKTKALTCRIAYLLKEKGVRPHQILAVTFTNKAAGEMKERLEKILGHAAQSLWLGTFHSTGLRILRHDGHYIGCDSNFIVYDDDDQLSLVKLCIAELGISEKSVSPRAVLSHINQAKNEVLSHQDYALSARDFFSKRVSQVYSLYQDKLRANRTFDFGDLIIEPIKLFNHSSDILKKYQERFRYILVDEYQDTNRAQYIFVNLIAQRYKNLCVVGDEDQSIYGWRGADIRNILDFEKDYPDAKIIKLEQNYRSTKNILSAANSVVGKNINRIGKTLWTENTQGDKPVFQMARDERHEAVIACSRIENLRRNFRYSYKDFAIFYRTNAQSRIFEEHFMRGAVPYTIVGGLRFYDRKEIKDSIAYLRVLANHEDSLSLMRIINTPPRGIGKSTIDRIAGLAKGKGVSVFECMKEIVTGVWGLEAGEGMSNRSLNSIKGFVSVFQKHKGQMDRTPLHETAKRILEEMGYIRFWEQEKIEEAEARVENIHELISAIKDFEMARQGAALSDFLDHVALVSDIDAFEDKHNRITMMTLHSAKGLEFPVVFMVGMEEGLFPHSRAIDSEKEDAIEEERRLCYVGMTRAMQKLFMTAARERTVYGDSRFRSPSRFIDEIDEEYVEMMGAEAKTVARDRGRWTSNMQNTRHSFEESFETHHEYSDDSLPKVGMKVRHPNFGVGVIRATEGIGEGMKVVVAFQNAGQRKLVLRLAGLVPL